MLGLLAIRRAALPARDTLGALVSYVVIRSEFIETLDEARAYYAARLAGAHHVTCHGRPVTIVFESDATHLYSRDANEGEGISPGFGVTRAIGGGRAERRVFSVERARMMDLVLPAVSCFTVSVPGTATTRGREKRMLHGPRLADARYMRVVLRPGPGEAFTCVSAYTVTEAVWMEARRAKSAKFPP